LVHRIYLVGLISSNIETHEWRYRVERMLLPRTKYVVSNPIRSKYDQELKKKYGGGEDNEFYSAQLEEDRAPSLLVPKSYAEVFDCDVIIANFDLVGERPMVGSIFELAWAWQLHKPVVAIHSGENHNDSKHPCEDKRNNLYVVHPFVKLAVTHWAKSEEEAVQAVKRHFV